MNTALVTGATSGLGREIALDLARRGWRLVLPVRTATRAHELVVATEALRAPTPSVVECDLSDHAAVRQMCRTVIGEGPLDLVVNNAAVGGGVDPTLRETNTAAVELRMAVNAITPHLIAQELSGALTSTGRIVQVGSMGQLPLDLDDLNYERDYEGIQAYCRSKVALVMSAIELAQGGIPVNVVHPAREMPTRMVVEGGFPIASTLDDGTLAVLRVALDSELSGVRGAYFHRFDRAEPHGQALDAHVRGRVVAWIEDRATLHHV
ncbi:SDR family NAD(P)-dependent oxidoreductase [Streptomyces cinnabarinus]|uniref:SDR family NAD(P)-dependent oxidoreductase n=1 Tax=Streptomyces cinnabarinus TaxID=67287 RepID=A0ABY7K6F8_9ACTN|nr:SDR family NAD(P)-dependent oxidoreductase [Streptomyces cinnabarinus]WAZ19098.1 SDR family NAD(P)-dependent oxidoreductase [Streptomyces cinnabarinus]